MNIRGTELQVHSGGAHSIGLFPLLLATADWLPPHPLCLAWPSSGRDVAQSCDVTMPRAASFTNRQSQSSTQIMIVIELPNTPLS